MLLYHRVLPADEADIIDRVLAVDLRAFESQMMAVAATACPVPLRDLVRQQYQADAADRRTRVAVTFDDGYRDVVEYALPVMSRLGIPPTIFLASGFVDRSVFPWWEQIGRHVRRSRMADSERLRRYRELERACKHTPDRGVRCILEDAGVLQEGESSGRSAGRLFITWDDVADADDSVYFENHTHSHECLRWLSASEATSDIGVADKLIETHAGRKAELFAFPGGGLRDISRNALKTVRLMGFSAAFAAGTPSRRFLSLPCAPSLLGLSGILPRYDVEWNTDLATFQGWIDQ